MSRKIRLLLGGATASGKSAAALEIAHRLGCEILGCDSGQLRCGMAIGTVAPTAEELNAVRHHLVGTVDPRENFSVVQFLDLAAEVLKEDGPDLVAVGGTGQYLSALRNGLKPVPPPDAELRRRAEALVAADPTAGRKELERLQAPLPPDDNLRRLVRALECAWALERGDLPVGRQALAPETPVFALFRPRPELHRRIERRLFDRLDAWQQEITELQRQGIPADAPGLSAIGYRELWDLPAGRVPEPIAFHILTATRQYAKRQETWLRTQLPAHWIHAGRTPAEDAVAVLRELA